MGLPAGVDRITEAEVTDEPAERPPDFDLPKAWQQVVEEVEQRRGTTPVSGNSRSSDDGHSRGAALQRQIAYPFVSAAPGRLHHLADDRAGHRYLAALDLLRDLRLRGGIGGPI